MHAFADGQTALCDVADSYFSCTWGCAARFRFAQASRCDCECGQSRSDIRKISVTRIAQRVLVSSTLRTENLSSRRSSRAKSVCIHVGIAVLSESAPLLV